MDTAIGYCRTSTDDQSLSLEAQGGAIQQAAAALGLTVAAYHEDAGVSGGAGIDEHPGLYTALNALGRGDTLIVAKLDRLSRDRFMSAWAEKEIVKRGARLVSAAGEGSGDSPADEMLRTIIGAFAAFELAQIRARTRAALAVKKSRGEAVGRAPYGWKLAPDKSITTRKGKPLMHLVPDPAKQAIVAEVLHLTPDHSNPLIAHMLGLHVTQVRRILKHTAEKSTVTPCVEPKHPVELS